MMLAEPQKDEIRRQLFKGYDWFQERTGYGFPVSGIVDIYMARSNDLPADNQGVKIRCEVADGKTSMSAYLPLERAEFEIGGQTFIGYGARGAWSTFRAGAKGLPVSPNAGRFVASLACMETTGKPMPVCIINDNKIYTTADVLEALRPQAEHLINDYIANNSEVTGSLKRAIIENARPNDLRQAVLDKLLGMANKYMVENIIVKSPQVAVSLINSMQEKEPFKSMMPYVEANDLAGELAMKKDATGFLRFLSEGLYDPQAKIDPVFRQFKTIQE